MKNTTRVIIEGTLEDKRQVEMFKKKLELLCLEYNLLAEFEEENLDG